MLSSHLILCHSLLLLPSIFPSIRVFSMSASGSQGTGTSASASVLSMNIQGWFPLKLDLFDLVAVQETLKSLHQHQSSKASVLWYSAFFTVQPSHPYMTPGKIIALTMCTFVGTVMPLLFNMLSRFAIAFLPRSKHLLISWLQSLSAVILESKKVKSVTASNFPPSIWHEVMELDAIILVF